MYELVHRYAPSSARIRLLLIGALVVTSLAGAVGTSMAGSTGAIVVAVLVTVAAAGLALSLGRGLVEQADAAPAAANPAARETPATEPVSDPIATLQQRYAEGELSDEEFERRMDRLLESGAGAENEPEERERSREQVIER